MSEVDVQQVSTRRRGEQVPCERRRRRRRRRRRSGRSGRSFPSFSRRLLDISGRQGRRLESLERCSVRQRGEGKKRGGSPSTPRRGYLGRGRGGPTTAASTAQKVTLDHLTRLLPVARPGGGAARRQKGSKRESPESGLNARPDDLTPISGVARSATELSRLCCDGCCCH